jgi:hypothetical protein
MLMDKQMYMINSLQPGASILKESAKMSYINQNEAEEPLEP